MQRLLGYVNWYVLFVPSLSSLTEPFQSLLSKNSPYVIDDAEKLISLEKTIELDITPSQPKSDLPFPIFVHTNDTNSAGCIFQRNEEGWLFIMTMINHKFKDQVFAKEADIKKLYAIYHTLKRYKALLFGRVIKINKELGTILSSHKDSAYISPLIRKSLVFINCFTVTQLDDETEPKKLREFLTKYEMIPAGNYDGPNQDDLILLGDTVLADEGSWNPCVLPITAPIKLQDMEYAKTITTVIQNIEEHQANDAFYMKTINDLKEKSNEDIDQSSVVEGAKVFKIFDVNQLLVLPQHAHADVILVVMGD